MKIMIVDVNYGRSSTGKIISDLVDMLSARGHEVRACFGRGPDVKSPTVRKIAASAEVYGHVLLTRITGLTGCFSPRATKRLIDEINLFQPDVVHLHELHGYYINIVELVEFLKEKKIPIVWTFHCEFMYTGKCGHAYDCEKWKTECRQCPQLREYPASWIFDFTNYMFHAKRKMLEGDFPLTIVTPSKWLENRVKNSFLGKKHLEVVHNGINMNEDFYPRNTELLVEKYNLRGKKIILSVAPGIMGDRKGGKFILELAKRFDEGYLFILVGVDAKESRYFNNVLMIERTHNQAELAEFYTAADIFMLTSQKETFSLVTVESLACGTPVIGFDSGAPAEIAPKGFGYFVPYGDLDGLESLVRGFFNSTLDFKNSQECRDFAITRYTKQKMAYAYERVYHETVHRWRNESKVFTHLLD